MSAELVHVGAVPNVIFEYMGHPLSKRSKIVRTFEPGTTVDEMLVSASVLPNRGSRLEVSCDLRPVHVSEWEQFLPPSGSSVRVVRVPRVTGVYLAVLTFLIKASVALGASGAGIAAGGALATGLVIAAGVITAGIYVGAAFALYYIQNALTPTPKQNNSSSIPNRASPTLQGLGNVAQRNGPHTSVYGDHVLFPAYGADPFLQFRGVDGDQFVRILFDLTYGPAEISELKLGDTPIENFENIEYALHYGDGTFDFRDAEGVITPGAYADPDVPEFQIYPSDVNQTNVSQNFEALYLTDVTRVERTGQEADEVEVDFIFPQGLTAIGELGKEFEFTVQITIEMQRVGDATWHDITAFPDFILNRNFKSIAAKLNNHDTDELPGGSPDISALVIRSIRLYRLINGGHLGTVKVELTPFQRNAVLSGFDPSISIDELNSILSSTIVAEEGETLYAFGYRKIDGGSFGFGSLGFVPGHFITSSGFANGANNGTFRVVSVHDGFADWPQIFANRIATIPSGDDQAFTMLVVTKTDGSSADLVEELDKSGTRVIDPNASSTPNKIEIRGHTKLPIRQTLRFRVPDGRALYDVRVKRFAGESHPESVLFGELHSPDRGGTNPTATTLADFQWTNMRAILRDTPPVRPKARRAYVELLIQSTNQLSGVPNEFNCRVKRLLPTFDPADNSGLGAWTDDPSYPYDVGTRPAYQATRNPSWAVCDALRGPANPNPISDSRIDGSAFDSFATFCEPSWPSTPDTAYDYALDAVVDFDTTVRDLAVDMAQVGRASLQSSYGVYTVVIDEEKSTVKQLFTARNVQKFTYRRNFLRRPERLVMKYMNRNVFQQDEITIYDDGFGESVVTESSLQANGLKDLGGGAFVFYNSVAGANQYEEEGFVVAGWVTVPNVGNWPSVAPDLVGETFLIRSFSVGIGEYRMHVSDRSTDAYPSGLLAGHAPISVTSSLPLYCTNAAVESETVDVFGETDTEQVFRKGRFLQRYFKLRPETYIFDVDWEVMKVTRGDLAQVAHPTIGVGTAWTRIERRMRGGVWYTTKDQGSGDVEAIELEHHTEHNDGISYGARVRTSDDGYRTEPVDNEASPTDPVVRTKTLTFTTPIASGVLPDVGDIVVFGESGIEVIDCIVAKIERDSLLTARVESLPHSPELFTTLAEEAAPNFQTNISRTQAFPRSAPLDPTLNSVRARWVPLSGTLFFQNLTSGSTDMLRANYMLDIGFSPAVVTGDVVGSALGARTQSVRIQYRDYGFLVPGAWQELGLHHALSGSVTLGPLPLVGAIEVRIQAIEPRGQFGSGWVSSGRILLTSKVNAVHDVRVGIDRVLASTSVRFDLIIAWSHAGNLSADPDMAAGSPAIGDGNEAAGFDVAWVYEQEEIQVAHTGLRSLRIPDARPGFYQFWVFAMGQNGERSPAVNLNVEIPVGMGGRLPRPSGLEIKGSGSGDAFLGRDITLQWRPVLLVTPKDLGDNTADPSIFAAKVPSYQVDVKDAITGLVLRSELVAGTSYEYSYDQNVSDGGPRRYIRFEVSAIDITGQAGDRAVKISGNSRNQVPVNPVSVDGSATEGTVTLGFINAGGAGGLDGDEIGISVWRSETPGFTPSDDNFWRILPFQRRVVVESTPGVDFYYSHRVVDAFDSIDPPEPIDVSSVSGPFASLPYGSTQLDDGSVSSESQAIEQGPITTQVDFDAARDFGGSPPSFSLASSWANATSLLTLNYAVPSDDRVVSVTGQVTSQQSGLYVYGIWRRETGTVTADEGLLSDELEDDQKVWTTSDYLPAFASVCILRPGGVGGNEVIRQVNAVIPSDRLQMTSAWPVTDEPNTGDTYHVWRLVLALEAITQDDGTVSWTIDDSLPRLGESVQYALVIHNQVVSGGAPIANARLHRRAIKR